MATIAFLIGAMVPTGALAALFIWLPGRYVKSILWRAVMANALALAATTVIGGLGMADGGPAKFDVAFWSYLGPQAIWLVAWLFILKGQQSAK